MWSAFLMGRLEAPGETLMGPSFQQTAPESPTGFMIMQEENQRLPHLFPSLFLQITRDSVSSEDVERAQDGIRAWRGKFLRRAAGSETEERSTEMVQFVNFGGCKCEIDRPPLGFCRRGKGGERSAEADQFISPSSTHSALILPSVGPPDPFELEWIIAWSFSINASGSWGESNCDLQILCFRRRLGRRLDRSSPLVLVYRSSRSRWYSAMKWSCQPHLSSG